MSKLLSETPEIHCACTEKSTSIPQCLYTEAHMNSYGDTNTPLVDWDLQAVPDMFKATHSQFWPFSKKQAEITRQLHSGILVTGGSPGEREANSSKPKAWMTPALQARGTAGSTFLSLWRNKIHSPVFVLTIYCRDRVNGMPTSRACLIQQERKANAWQPHLLLPPGVPCNLVCAVPYTYLLTT